MVTFFILNEISILTDFIQRFVYGLTPHAQTGWVCVGKSEGLPRQRPTCILSLLLERNALTISEAVDPKTGKSFQVECKASSEDELRELLAFDVSEDALKKRIDSLAVSADTKSVLYKMAKTTITVGSTVLKIGRKILDIVVKVLSEFPNAGIGVIFGAVLGYLVASIPIIGFLLGPFLGPLAIALGFAVGVMQDLANKSLERRIMASLASFETLKPRV